LRVLIDNLVLNAARYASGSPVEIAVGPTTEGGMELRMRDHGPGIPADQRELVFERFVRLPSVEPASSGAGLGLAIVAQIARAHGATFRIEQADPGARIVVRFAALSGNGETRAHDGM
jgi:signal transduction histidine kinase